MKKVFSENILGYIAVSGNPLLFTIINTNITFSSLSEFEKLLTLKAFI